MQKLPTKRSSDRDRTRELQLQGHSLDHTAVGAAPFELYVRRVLVVGMNLYNARHYRLVLLLRGGLLLGTLYWKADSASNCTRVPVEYADVITRR